ncbi:MAG: single-stranded-DNA-specific exonuclease RecJ, partial [Flavobacteriaceae bacterium]|nr:single-stranded-DNA-specific exonuclease RecJ [Flavobacteriaceae bacterium]
ENEKHLKAAVRQDGSKVYGAIGFNLGNKCDEITNGKPFSAVYSIDENEWNGKVSLQLKLRDIKAETSTS